MNRIISEELFEEICDGMHEERYETEQKLRNAPIAPAEGQPAPQTDRPVVSREAIRQVVGERMTAKVPDPFKGHLFELAPALDAISDAIYALRTQPQASVVEVPSRYDLYERFRGRSITDHAADSLAVEVRELITNQVAKWTSVLSEDELHKVYSEWHENMARRFVESEVEIDYAKCESWGIAGIHALTQSKGWM